MKYDFDKVVDRRGTFAKWDGIPEVYPDAMESGKTPLAMYIADMDFPAPDSVREAIRKVADMNIYGYSAVFNNRDYCKPYFDAITNWYKRHHNWEIFPETITYFPGTIPALEATINAFTHEKDGVLITPPVYGPFASTIKKTKRELVRSILVNNDGYYTVDFDDFEKKAADPNTKMFVLCNPHNPTGRVWRPKELIRMYEICEKHEVLVVADEIHGDLIRRGETFRPIATLVDGKHLIAFTAPNKTFNLADLKATNVVITNPKLQTRFRNVVGFTYPSLITTVATIAAYNGGDEWLDQLKEYLDETIDWVVDFVAKEMPHVKLRRPEGTYILWMDFRGYGLSPDEVDERILKKTGVILERGELFDPEAGVGFQRICIPTQRAMVKEAFYRLKEEFED